MDKLIAMGELFGISLDELVLGRVPVTTRLDELGNKVLTDGNKKKAKKGLKIAGLVLVAALAIDLISMAIYFLAFGFPK